MKLSLIYLLLSALLVVPVTLSAQLNITNAPPYNNPQTLVNNVLIGNGVSAFNVQMYGSSVQAGYFTGGVNSIGIDSGIVLASEDINQIPSPGGTPATIPIGANSGRFGPASMGAVGNNDLLSVAQSVPPLIGQTFTVSSAEDACVLEFDFVPLSDTVQFEFVFGSEEYPDYTSSPPAGGFINQPYNDVFGFFVSGPGITGPYSSPAGFPGGSQNVAVVPNSSPQLPITISSVHGGNNSVPALNGQYFNPVLQSNLNLRGMTVPLVATLPLTACDTFHIRLAIADGSDRALVSSVFLAANSFETKGYSVAASPSYSTYGGDSVAYEGCGNVDLTFTRSSNIQNSDTIDMVLSGTAINGVDYSFLPNQVIFSPGQDSVTLSFNVPDDNFTEGTETFQLAVLDASICASTGGDTVRLKIKDPIPLTNTITSDTTIDCTTDSVDIVNNTTTGFPPFTYTWSTGATGQNITVKPGATSNYAVTIADACGVYSTVDSTKVTLYTPPFSTSYNADTINCSVDSVEIGVPISDGYPEITYLWGNGKTDSSIWVSSNVDTSLFVTTSLGCSGQQETDTFDLTVENQPFSVVLPDDTTDCRTDSIQLAPQVTGIIDGFTYNWSTGSTDSSIWVDPDSTAIYQVTITDACGLTYQVKASTVTYEVKPFTISTNRPVLDCFGDQAELKVTVSGGYPGYAYLWSNGATGSSQTVKPNRPRRFSVQVTDTCGLDTLVGHVDVDFKKYALLDIQNMENPFLNCPGDTVTLGPVNVLGGSGDNTVQWYHEPDTSRVSVVSTDTTRTYTVRADDNCNNDSATHKVTINIINHEPLDMTLTENRKICRFDTVQLATIPVNGAGFYEYRWVTGETDSTIVVTPEYTTGYSVTVTDDCGNQVFDNVKLSVHQPEADFIYKYETNSKIQFTNKSSPDATGFLWEFGEEASSIRENPTYGFSVPNSYPVKLVVENDVGCTDSIEILIDEPLQVFTPNAFTPNGDGLNDEFIIPTNGVDNYVLRIYDRWGKLLFETSDYQVGWDGTSGSEVLPQGIYVYKITVEGINKQLVKKAGSVMLLRK